LGIGKPAGASIPIAGISLKMAKILIFVAIYDADCIIHSGQESPRRKLTSVVEVNLNYTRGAAVETTPTAYSVKR
jgi:hypothetical protein